MNINFISTIDKLWCNLERFCSSNKLFSCTTNVLFSIMYNMSIE